MSLTGLLDTIRDQLRARLPEMSIETHRGRFDADELKRFMIDAPAIRLALLGLTNPEPASDGGCDWTVKLVAIVITRDTGALKREASASAIVETAMLTAFENNWGFDWVYPAEPATARNLYSGALDKSGAGLWAIEWDQRVRLAPPAEPGGPVPSELYIGFTPDVGPDHVDAYIKIEGEPDA